MHTMQKSKIHIKTRKYTSQNNTYFEEVYNSMLHLQVD